MLRPALPALMLSLVMCAGVMGCSRVPELEDRLTPDLRGAAYPTLIPLGDALPPQTVPAEEGADLDAELKARAARLKARAAALNNTNI
ncbi:hypothetical protein [Epibacterium ulvae]|uniref:hypothetical protein n=1 Tax=Epibacterium ulvae TaxID=1156985 RepID=UPI002040C54B|nr:hypothetical protein [Epibacterium ulvae]